MLGSTRNLSLLAGLALSAASLSALPAGAAAPTIRTDSTVSVACRAVAQDGATLVVGAQRSESQGLSVAFADLTGPDGEVLGEGAADSSWSQSTVGATIPLYSRPPEDGGGHRWYQGGVEAAGETAGDHGQTYVGDVRFTGTYATAGDPVTEAVKGQDGNVHYSQSNTLTPLDVTGVTVALDDGQSVTAFTVERCAGESGEGRLMFTNPRVLVQRAAELTYECTAENASRYPEIARVDEGWYVDLSSADFMTSAFGVFDFGKDGTWSGTFRVADEEGSQTTVPAAATLVLEDSYHVTRGDTGRRDHAQVDVYSLHLYAELPDQAPARVDCTLWDADLTLRSVNGS